MHPLRLVRAGTPVEVSVLAIMVGTAAAACLAWAAFPMAQQMPRGTVLAIGLAGLAVALSLIAAGGHVSPRWLHAAVTLYTAMLGVMVAIAATERGLMISALGYLWLAFYAGFFFRPEAARIHAVIIIAALGTSMLLARAASDVAVWATLSGMVAVAVAVISKLHSRLQAEAHTDALTGVLNRTGFAHAAARHRAMAQRREEAFALAVIDLDGFKEVNDRDGHAAGDQLLADLAAAWTGALRPGDLIARFGGDEFVLLLPGVNERQIGHVLSRLQRVHPAAWTAGAVMCVEDESLDDAMARADSKLYLAKARADRPERVKMGKILEFRRGVVSGTG